MDPPHRGPGVWPGRCSSLPSAHQQMPHPNGRECGQADVHPFLPPTSKCRTQTAGSVARPMFIPSFRPPANAAPKRPVRACVVRERTHSPTLNSESISTAQVVLQHNVVNDGHDDDNSKTATCVGTWPYTCQLHSSMIHHR